MIVSTNRFLFFTQFTFNSEGEYAVILQKAQESYHEMLQKIFQPLGGDPPKYFCPFLKKLQKIEQNWEKGHKVISKDTLNTEWADALIELKKEYTKTKDILDKTQKVFDSTLQQCQLPSFSQSVLLQLAQVGALTQVDQNCHTLKRSLETIREAQVKATEVLSKITASYRSIKGFAGQAIHRLRPECSSFISSYDRVASLFRDARMKEKEAAKSLEELTEEPCEVMVGNEEKKANQ